MKGGGRPVAHTVESVGMDGPRESLVGQVDCLGAR